MISKAVWLAIAALVGATVAYSMIPSDPLVYRDVVVPARVIIEREPDTIRTFVDRIRFVEAPARQIATAPGGAASQVQEFCTPTIVAQTDTVEVGQPVDPMLLLRSVSYNRRWAWRRDHLLVTGPLSTGDLVAEDYEVRGDWTVAVRGSSSLVQYPRTSFLYDIWEGGSQIFTLYKVGEFLMGSLN
jgi:hypothetical protein